MPRGGGGPGERGGDPRRRRTLPCIWSSGDGEAVEAPLRTSGAHSWPSSLLGVMSVLLFLVRKAQAVTDKVTSLHVAEPGEEGASWDLWVP